ncbi:MAG: winged helix-turn-helix domain-containing protein [Candidatus Heimdallarchaeota archaeon]|nr:winged helix-turn-helix domain-containing protein [Candidatus Heimdallarchaeota archaeon]
MLYEIPRLPKSSKKILLLLAAEGTLTQKEIIALSGIPAKTVRYALKKLGESDLILTKPSLMDMRSSFYSLNHEFDNLISVHVEEARNLATA